MAKHDETNTKLGLYRLHFQKLQMIKDALKVKHAKTPVWPQVVKAFEMIHDGKAAMIDDNDQAVEVPEA